MRQIDAGDVQRIIARMTAKGYGPKTIRNLWGTISLIWQAALAQRYVDAVLPKPKLPKLAKKKPRFFRLADVARIIAFGRQRSLYWLMAETGLRAGEVAGLRVQDVGLDNITVAQSVWAGEEPDAEDPKRSQEDCDFTASIRTALETGGTADCRWTLFSVQRQHWQSAGHERGTQATAETDAQSSGIPQAGYHAFRHFNVSVLDSLRVPLKTIQERIGHALTGSFTLDVYGHTLDWKANEEAAQRLGDELAKAVADAENSDNSGRLTAIKQKSFHSLKMEVF
jgi:integrase